SPSAAHYDELKNAARESAQERHRVAAPSSSGTPLQILCRSLDPLRRPRLRSTGANFRWKCTSSARARRAACDGNSETEPSLYVQPEDAGGTGPEPAATVGGHGFQGNGFSSVAQTRKCPTSLSHCARELPKAAMNRLGSAANKSHRNCTMASRFKS